jgi:hypothetical protein
MRGADSVRDWGCESPSLSRHRHRDPIGERFFDGIALAAGLLRMRDVS